MTQNKQASDVICMIVFKILVVSLATEITIAEWPHSLYKPDCREYAMNHACLPSVGKAVSSFQRTSLRNIPYPLCEGFVESLTFQSNPNWSPAVCSGYRSAIAILIGGQRCLIRVAFTKRCNVQTYSFMTASPRTGSSNRAYTL